MDKGLFVKVLEDKNYYLEPTAMFLAFIVIK